MKSANTRYVRRRVRDHRRRCAGCRRGRATRPFDLPSADALAQDRPLVVAHILQIDRRKVVAVEHDGPVRAGQFEPPRIAGIGGSSPPRWCRARRSRTRSARPTCPPLRLRAASSSFSRPRDANRAEQPQQQVHGVHALVHQRAAAVERPCSAPARALHRTTAAGTISRERSRGSGRRGVRRRRAISTAARPASADPGKSRRA